MWHSVFNYSYTPFECALNLSHFNVKQGNHSNSILIENSSLPITRIIDDKCSPNEEIFFCFSTKILNEYTIKEQTRGSSKRCLLHVCLPKLLNFLWIELILLKKLLRLKTERAPVYFEIDLFSEYAKRGSRAPLQPFFKVNDSSNNLNQRFHQKTFKSCLQEGYQIAAPAVKEIKGVYKKSLMLRYELYFACNGEAYFRQP